MSDTLDKAATAATPTNAMLGHDAASTNQAPAKRRKIRKGTRSCWECIRRKTKCLFGSPEDLKCLSCQRRHTVCLSQDLPEDDVAERRSKRRLDSRIGRVEDFITNILTHNNGELTEDTLAASHNLPLKLPTSVSPFHAYRSSTISDVFPVEHTFDSGLHAVTSQDKSEATLYHLFAALPQQKDLHILLRESDRTTRYNHFRITQPQNKLTLDILGAPFEVAQLPPQDSHPVTVAKWMLTLAITLQTPCKDNLVDLIESPETIASRLVSSVADCVTSKAD